MQSMKMQTNARACRRATSKSIRASRVTPCRASAAPPRTGAAAAAAAAANLAIAGMALADGGAIADGSALSAVGTAVGVACLGGGAAVLLQEADPEKRRSEMTAAEGGDEMASVKKYFETEGANRWTKIYGETDEINGVQMDIRTGHQQTVDKIIAWMKESDLKGRTVADCGCGTGSLAVPLALEGASVAASDISGPLAEEAKARYESAIAAGSPAPATAPTFEVSDLESFSGSYNTVTCVDVMIHYPQGKVDKMVGHLASLSEEKLIISFAPKTPYYSFLKRVGELAPGPSKATRAYLHKEEDVEAAVNAAGFKVTRKEMTAGKFYYSRLFECVKA